MASQYVQTRNKEVTYCFEVITRVHYWKITMKATCDQHVPDDVPNGSIISQIKSKSSANVWCTGRAACISCISANRIPPLLSSIIGGNESTKDHVVTLIEHRLTPQFSRTVVPRNGCQSRGVELLYYLIVLFPVQCPELDIC